MFLKNGCVVLNSLKLKRFVLTLLLIAITKLTLLCQVTKIGKELNVTDIQLCVPFGLRVTNTQISIKNADIRVFSIKPHSRNNKEEYHIFPIEFINSDTGSIETLNPLIHNMQVKIEGRRVSTANKINSLKNLKVSGMISPGLSPHSLSFDGERMYSPYGFTFILHDGLVALKSINAITKGDWLGAVFETQVNDHDTIIFTHTIKPNAENAKDEVELIIAGPGANLLICDGSIVGVDGLANKAILPYKPADQQTIKISNCGSMITVTYKTENSTVQLLYSWLIKMVNGKETGILILFKKEDI
ncbi:MAG: hypothetical protein Q7U54_10460 [Bacteroidales bacterium]|nr:hypothetical protein [Bacteroidales bacterium]